MKADGRRPERDRGLLSQYDHRSYLCCSGNVLRVARRGAAERRRHHGAADGFLNS